jgi:hypothetical protein
MVQPRDATNTREGTETHCCAKLTPTRDAHICRH